MIVFGGSLLTGVEASAAQNAPVTKTCLQCGAILPSSIRVCNFCDSSFTTESPYFENLSASSTQGSLALKTDPGQEAAWRGELAHRLEVYRVRRRRLAQNSGQSKLPFENSTDVSPARSFANVAEPPPKEEFSFTIAIGRCAPKREDTRMFIDVSLPPPANSIAPDLPSMAVPAPHPGLHPVASLDERRMAALADAACLFFAYGGFLALFGSLGGQFTLSKLSAAVCITTFAIVYLQYFSLFTIFGGTTPGMMLRGLQVVSFSGEPPTPRQMFLRSTGYVLSAGTFFLGFLWAMWDEDALTWHDRLSHTYLSSVETFEDFEAQGVVHGR